MEQFSGDTSSRTASGDGVVVAVWWCLHGDDGDGSSSRVGSGSGGG